MILRTSAISNNFLIIRASRAITVTHKHPSCKVLKGFCKVRFWAVDMLRSRAVWNRTHPTVKPTLGNHAYLPHITAALWLYANLYTAYASGWRLEIERNRHMSKSHSATEPPQFPFDPNTHPQECSSIWFWAILLSRDFSEFSRDNHEIWCNYTCTKPLGFIQVYLRRTIMSVAKCHEIRPFKFWLSLFVIFSHCLPLILADNHQ